jgi:hypothetical protein
MGGFSGFSRIHYEEAHEDNEGMIAKLALRDPMTGVLYGHTAKEQIFSHWWV